MPTDPQVIQLPAVPVMHWRKFAQCVGIGEEIVRGLCEKGHLPSLTLGKHRFVNLALLTQQCLKAGEFK